MPNPIIDALLTRRSVLVRDLQAPGPSEEQLKVILAAAARVPDHGKLGPWRFILFAGESRGAFGRHLAEIFADDNPGTTDKNLDFERERFLRAPLVIGVVSSPVDHKVPKWEQVLSTGAVCQNLLLAAYGLGFGAQWLTEWYAYHKRTAALLALKPDERIAGFIYVGSYQDKPEERNRPDLEERVSYWSE